MVWQNVLTAVAAEGSEPAIRLAYTAIGHPAAEVRRRACEHLAAHPSPAHAEVLLPALQDANPGGGDGGGQGPGGDGANG